MGRHSAPDEDEEDGSAAAPAAATAVDLAPRRGRHAVPDDDEDDKSAVGTDVQPAGAGRFRPPQVGRGNQSTAADLALLRSHSDVRARVIAAGVAPFVLYTVAIYLVGGLDVFFLWIWAPLVTAGVLAGSILDAAHRKRGRT
jgi:hypothetical protein